MSKPNKTLNWATSDVTDAVSGQPNVAEPPTDHKTDGWDRNETPPRQYDNWWKRYAHMWVTWFDDRLTKRDTKLDKSVAGSSNVTLTQDEANYNLINLTGAITANIIVYLPIAENRKWTVKNSTTGAFTVTLKAVSGTVGTILQSGRYYSVHADATDTQYLSGNYATTVIEGASRLATAAEASTGSSESLAVTPYGLVQKINAVIASYVTTSTYNAHTAAGPTGVHGIVSSSETVSGIVKMADTKDFLGASSTTAVSPNNLFDWLDFATDNDSNASLPFTGHQNLTPNLRVVWGRVVSQTLGGSAPYHDFIVDTYRSGEGLSTIYAFIPIPMSKFDGTSGSSGGHIDIAAVLSISGNDATVRIDNNASINLTGTHTLAYVAIGVP